MTLRVYHDHNGVYRYMVAAKNQKEAARLLGVSVNDIRNYGGTYADPETIAVAMSMPGRVWKRPLTTGFKDPAPWVLVEECP